jgi:hypothetical protein
MQELEAKGLDVLRIELRYCNTKTIKRILKSIGSTRAPTFRELFDYDLAKKIVNYEWNKYTEEMLVAELDADAPYEIVTNLMKSGVNLHKALEALGLQLVMNQIGVRKYRTLIDTYGLGNSWPATKRLLEQCPRMRHESIQIVDRDLREFKLIKSLT